MKYTLVAALVLGSVGCYVWSVEQRIARIAAEEDESVTTKWVSGGQTRSVTTLRDSGESNADWRARHFEAVTAAQDLHPPD